MVRNKTFVIGLRCLALGISMIAYSLAGSRRLETDKSGSQAGANAVKSPATLVSTDEPGEGDIQGSSSLQTPRRDSI